MKSDAVKPPALLFLIGYRGTGKSTVARLLAKQLGWEFADTDELVEQNAGRSISQIFAQDGEAGFRNLEAAVLNELSSRRNCVIATGGGIVIRPANRELLRTSGRVVWLTADAQTIWGRLQQDADSGQRRPTLTVGGLAEVEQLLRVREPLYGECSTWIVDTAVRSPQAVAESVRRRLTEH